MPAVRAGQRNPSFQIARPHQLAGHVAVRNTIVSWNTERLIGYVAVLVIAAGLLFVEYPFLNYWLLPPSIGQSLMRGFGLLLWVLILIVALQRLRCGEKLGSSVLLLSALAFLDLVLSMFRTYNSLETILVNQWKPFLICMVCYFVARDERTRRFLARLIIGVNILNLALIFLLPTQFYSLKSSMLDMYYVHSRGGESTLTWQETGAGGATGIYPYRADAGLLSAVAACLSFVIPGGTLLSVMLIVLNIIGVIASRALSPTVGLVTGLVVILWKSLRKSIGVSKKVKGTLQKMLVATVLLAIFLFGLSKLNEEAISSFVDRFSFSATGAEDNLFWSWASRLDEYRTGVLAIFESPLWGWGEHDLRSFVGQYGSRASELPHNMYLYVTARNGIVYILLFGVLLLRAFKGFKINASTKSLGARFLGAFIATLVTMMAHPQYLTWMLWILIGVGLALWESRYDSMPTIASGCSRMRRI
jgi:O-antigen ligase